VPKGQIIAQLASEPFCFQASVMGVKLKDSKQWEYKTLLGIFWSSLARYYFFLTSSKWGVWHDEIQLQDIRKMPIRLPNNRDIRKRIVEAVDKLLERNLKTADILRFDDKIKQAALERELDEAIFQLYELSDAERDLVRDMCEFGIEFYYENLKSEGIKSIDEKRPTKVYGRYHDIPLEHDNQAGLEGYLHAFLQTWNRELEPDGEFRWRIIRRKKNSPLIAVIFSTQRKDEPLPEISHSDDEKAWSEVLYKLKNDLLVPYNSQRIYIDGMIRAVTGSEIIIINRNEKRLWTRSMAREDAEATLLQAINLQEAKYRANQ
jgi:hypothetical protein